MTYCKICNWPETKPVPFEVPAHQGVWRRCTMCGSDSSSHQYSDVAHMYTKEYIVEHSGHLGNMEALERECLSNCEWFNDHAEGLANRDFLDVGCCDGSALNVMQRLGWRIHGFDVVEPPYMGPHVTVRPYFHRWWFPNRYGAVLAREVIEHVDSPALFLQECHGVLSKGGLFQVQTPKPINAYHDHIYITAHLSIISTEAMRKLLNDALFDIIDFREWGDETRQSGQAYICRAR